MCDEYRVGRMGGTRYLIRVTGCHDLTVLSMMPLVFQMR